MATGHLSCQLSLSQLQKRREGINHLLFGFLLSEGVNEDGNRLEKFEIYIHLSHLSFKPKTSSVGNWYLISQWLVVFHYAQLTRQAASWKEQEREGKTEKGLWKAHASCMVHRHAWEDKKTDPFHWISVLQFIIESAFELLQSFCSFLMRKKPHFFFIFLCVGMQMHIYNF